MSNWYPFRNVLVNLRKFVSEFLEEWPILFMGNEEAHEWIMERRGKGSSTEATNILCNSEKTKRRLLENIADEPFVSTGSGTDTDGLFDSIWGFEDIKALFRRAISSQNRFIFC